MLLDTNMTCLNPHGLDIHSKLTLEVQIIPIWIFAILNRYLNLQLFLETLETFYECVISLELCGKLIFKKKELID